MTHRLHRVLHEVASAAVLESPDVERLVMLGRIRVRRMTAAGLAVALTTAAALLAMYDDEDEAPGPGSGPGSEDGTSGTHTVG